ncbi:MAG TPA: transporter [Burkholderiales bacterium]|nr:transporter [Burkholderiales bacterium]
MTSALLRRRVALALTLAGFMPVAHAQSEPESPQQLERELAARDAVIADLQRRMRALEERLGGVDRNVPVASTANPPRQLGGLGLKAEPADTEDEEEALARALERSLVLSGGVLLPAGRREITPAVRYDYNRRSGLAVVGGAIAPRDVRRDNAAASLGFKLGLPWSSQLELTVPYGYQQIESVTAGVPSSARDSGLGDVQAGVSKQLLTESGRRPGLLANVTWQKATGRSGLAFLGSPAAPLAAPATSLGLGYDAFSTTLTAVKRSDPLVFLGSLSHSFNRSDSVNGFNVDPSDTNSAAVRAIFAASPSVSLRGGFTLARTGNTKLNGVTIQGSRQNAALLELGGSVTFSRKTLLDVTVAAGLTQDSPDYLLGVALPIRF